jgi:hypothetical protein
MSNHTAGILFRLPGKGKQALAPETFGIQGLSASHDLSFKESIALGRSGVAVGVVDGWGCILGSYLCMRQYNDKGTEVEQGPGLWNKEIQREVFRIARSSEVVFGFVMERETGTCGFDLYLKGELKRLYMITSGEIQLDFGEELPEEDELHYEDSDLEAGLFSLLSAKALAYDKLAAGSFKLFSSDELELS